MLKSNLRDLTGRAREILTGQLPAITDAVTSRAGELAKEHSLALLQDDERLKLLFGQIYQTLPLPVRMLIGQEAFLRFCLDQKAVLLAKLLPKEGKPAVIGKQKPKTPMVGQATSTATGAAKKTRSKK